MKKRFWHLPIILIFAVVACFSLFACDNPENKEPTEYGQAVIKQRFLVNVCDNLDAITVNNSDACGEYFAKNIYLTNASFNSYNSCTVYDESTLKDVVYVGDKTMDNAVITTKWMYYYSVYTALAKENATLPIAEISGNQMARDILFDEYCMEKVNVHPLALKVNGNPLSNSLWGNMTDAQFNNLMTTCKTEPICSTYCGELTVAALHRYNALEVSEINGTGILEIYLDGEKEEVYKTLNVVGYIETEADKLLSTGVSMNENSEEYKTVIEQLANTKIYSLSGNILQ